MKTLLIILTLLNVCYGEESIKPKIEFLRSVDPCNVDKSFSFVIDIGDIISEDQFYGFDYSVKYDTNKVRFVSVNTGNTQMDKFSHKFNYNEIEFEEVRGTGGILGSSPLTGTGWLVGFRFEYISDDFSDATFSINYLVMTEEYTREIDLSNSTFTFTPIVKDQGERLLSINSSQNVIEIDSSYKSEASLNLELYSDNRLNSFDFALRYNKNILNITLDQNENYELEEILSNENESIFRIRTNNNFNSLSSLKLQILQNKEYDEENEFDVEYGIVDWDKKSCITRSTDFNSFNVKTYKMVSTSIFYEVNKTELINVFDIYGIKNNEIKMVMDLDKLDKGLYFIQYRNKIEKIIIN